MAGVSVLKASRAALLAPSLFNRGISKHIIASRRMSPVSEEMDEPVRLVSPAKNERVGKVIMLHGWAQNAFVFQNKSKNLTK